MSSAERTADIWATRIQQELLALTTDNADLDSTSEARSMLPSFTQVKQHKLDLEHGTCIVVVQVDVQGEEIPMIEIELEASVSIESDRSAGYPFVAPVARLTSGMEAFPPGSTIKDGDLIPMDLDWTPSLHLTDVILNLALKIKESVLQKEPFHPQLEKDQLADAVDEVARELSQGARRFAASISQKATSFSKAFTPKGSAVQQRQQHQSPRNPMPQSPHAQVVFDVKIGDEINWLEDPWTEAHGVYNCKPIRRPKFVEVIMAQSKKKEESVTSPSSMFRSFAQSARSVMEESFLMVTETHIIELRANKFNMQNIGTVVFCMPIDKMQKLKFRRQESLSLFFKPAPDDPLIYMCPDSGDAVHQIQTVLKRKGVRGKHTNASAYKVIHEALLMVQEIQTKEIAVEHEPSVERVNEIMDLYRQAAEKFELAGDIRHEEVITHMRQFLAKPSTVAILDGSYKKPSDPIHSEKFVPEGEVLERVVDDDYVEEDLHDDKVKKASEEPCKKQDIDDDKQFEDNIDNLLRDAKEDFQLDDDFEEKAVPGTDKAGDDLADMTADLDALMKEADEEFAALMNS